MQTEQLQEQTNFTEVFYCPITGSLMRDPVIAEDGQTYDNESIKEWINTKGGKSPFTG
jgi:hypothetical protein